MGKRVGVTKPEPDFWVFRLAGMGKERGEAIALDLDLLNVVWEGRNPGETILTIDDRTYTIEYDFNDFVNTILQADDCRRQLSLGLPKPTLSVVTQGA